MLLSFISKDFFSGGRLYQTLLYHRGRGAVVSSSIDKIRLIKIIKMSNGDVTVTELMCHGDVTVTFFE